MNIFSRPIQVLVLTHCRRLTIKSMVSLENLKKLASKGIKIVIGPGTSAAVQGIIDYADKNGIILISPSATAPSSEPGDNFFRFVPDDTHQAPAISELMETMG